MVLLAKRPREDDRLHSRLPAAPRDLKRSASQEKRVELVEECSEVDVRVNDDPVRFAVWPRDVAVQAHRDHVANPSHRSLPVLTTKPTAVYIKPRTSENIYLPRTAVNKGEEKGRGRQQVRSTRALAARLARLVPGERAVHPLRRSRRWEFAGRGRGEGLEEVADQPVGALGCVFGGGGDDPGVGHQQQWDVFGHEVLSEAPGGLGPLDQLRDSVVDAVPLCPEFAGVGKGLGQDVAE